MSSRARRKVQKDVDESVWNMKTMAVLVVVLACSCLVIFGISKLKRSHVASLPQEFEGQIVEKSVGFNETEQGSYPYFRLLVDVEGHSRLTVPVNREIYEEAQVGMRLKRSLKGLEVIRGPTGSTAVP